MNRVGFPRILTIPFMALLLAYVLGTTSEPWLILPILLVGSMSVVLESRYGLFWNEDTLRACPHGWTVREFGWTQIEKLHVGRSGRIGIQIENSLWPIVTSPHASGRDKFLEYARNRLDPGRILPSDF